VGYDVFASVREHAMRVADELYCVQRAQDGALSVARETWSDHVASLDWFLTYYGRQCALED
jgi:hypothetical protein